MCRCFAQTRYSFRLRVVLSIVALATMSCCAILRGEETESDRHWSYRLVQRPAIPAVTAADLVQTPVDAFLLSELERRNLTYSGPAGRAELLRRVKLDLIGLPPTPDELEAFLADESTDAYERLVDRLLDSPQYGERWARMWLDVVRYSDTAGYNADPLRPLAWKYRDYVIRSFNADKPYDQFIREQVAGDELYPDNTEAVIGTGFLRLPPDESNASNVELARQDLLNDLAANVGTIFLAQSMGCAQCHDHKFDEIAQQEFYQLQAFFSGLVWVDEHPVGTPEQLADYRQNLNAWLAETSSLRHELQQLEMPVRLRVSKEKRMKFPPIVLAALDTLPEERTAHQIQLSFFAERQMEYKDGDLTKVMTAEQKARRSELQKQLAARIKDRPAPPAKVEAMIATNGRETPKAFLLAGGSYNKPRDEVQPGFPAAFSRSDIPIDNEHRRSSLARWLTDPRHPLVARVAVNRLWQAHFGRGLVSNANDFGVQTPGPSHPELLDWLAAEFVAPSVSSGEPWTMKRIHRLIVLSSAYRQSTARDTDDEFVYQRYPRRRLEAEVIRDSMLAVGGLLESRMYGPGVQPELPPGYSAREAWTASKDPSERRRRSVYILSKRNLPYPMLQAFDLPDAFESCACRTVTTTAPQALLLLNSELTVDYARAFASRLLAENPEAEPARLIFDAWRMAFQRPPTSEELETATQYLSTAAAAPNLDRLPRPYPKFLAPERAAVVVDFCHALFNTNEFVYAD